ncbi:recombinase family protein [Rhizobium laguerreae]|uniref:recombinase family protein n=1 Tax=Rhizobium laguerreae TaxID=1076926 RepID=UPI001C907067|nr:recombinase family protein [Rhizobium laguerreae]MBY3167376.1 recombinase family protein [Rhizobium laguerreae]
MTKAYSYIRFSSPEQAQGDSLRRQTAKAEAWAQQRGLVLDDSLRDLGVSAYHGANRTTGALKSFLEMVEDGRIPRGSYLIVESLDRISREAVMDAATRLFALIQAGIIVVTLSDGQEYSEERLRADWLPLVFSLIVMARAHEESRIKSERVGEAWKQKKEKARDERKPLTRRCPEWLEIRDGAFVERPERVALIRRVFQETIDGFGRREIVRRLNSEGIPTFRGGEGWQTSSVAKIIQSRAVLGEYQPHSGTHRNGNRKAEGDPIPDYYPPIIESATYWQALGAIQGRRQNTAGRTGMSGSHLFQGLARCAHCDGAMHIVNKGRPPKGGIYLACSNNMRNVGCDNVRRWRVDALEPPLIAAVDMLDQTAFHGENREVGQLRAKGEAMKTQIADFEQRQRGLIPLVEIGDDTATARSIELAKLIKRAKKDLTAIDNEVATAAAAPDLAANLASAASISKRLEESTDIEERRELRTRLRTIIRTLIDRVEFHHRFGATAFFHRREWFRINNRRSRYHFQQITTDGIPKVLLDQNVPDEIIDEWVAQWWS